MSSLLGFSVIRPEMKLRIGTDTALSPPSCYDNPDMGLHRTITIRSLLVDNMSRVVCGIVHMGIWDAF